MSWKVLQSATIRFPVEQLSKRVPHWHLATYLRNRTRRTQYLRFLPSSNDDPIIHAPRPVYAFNGGHASNPMGAPYDYRHQHAIAILDTFNRVVSEKDSSECGEVDDTDARSPEADTATPTVNGDRNESIPADVEVANATAAPRSPSISSSDRSVILTPRFPRLAPTMWPSKRLPSPSSSGRCSINFLIFDTHPLSLPHLPQLVQILPEETGQSTETDSDFVAWIPIVTVSDGADRSDITRGTNSVSGDSASPHPQQPPGGTQHP